MLTTSKARYPSYQGSMMATYFQGGSEIQAAAAGDNLQTLYLMNPNYMPTAAYNSESHAPHHTQTPPNMLLLNSGHAPPPHHQQFIGIPLGCGPHSDNLWSPTADHSPGAQAHRGLSLSLSPDHNRRGRQSTVTVAARNEVQVQGVISGSKYLKAAQELLEEVVNVGSIGKNYRGGGDDGDHVDQLSGAHKEKAKAGAGGAGESTSGGGKRAAEHQLSTAQRQELQMKKAKLHSMLDEVEQRYRQYQTQMQLVMSSFEQAAGVGAAKLYTSVALKTISKQFRCLKDAIGSQIKATSKSLGEEDDHNGGAGKLEGGAGSRLRFVDHQLRQQQALHQLGMMPPNAWRPQRGLPERAVSVLRAWLFEHFLHPYPKDSDKHMLAKQTGLTRSQVSNWFINARVRLWKPMVEEMYAEEMKTQEQNGGNSQANTNTASTNNNDTPSKNDHNKDQSMPKATLIAGQQHQQQQEDHGGCLIQINHHQQADHHHHHQTTTTNDMISNLSTMSTTSPQGFALIGGNSSSGMESFMTRSSPKKQRSNSDLQNSPSSILSMDMEIKPIDHHHHNHHGDANAGFNPYIVNEINIAGRFNPGQVLTPHQYHGNGAVSLTLGLPPCDNLTSIGAGEADFCGISMGQPPSHNPGNGFESIDIQTRKRFAAQLLHDFVA